MPESTPDPIFIHDEPIWTSAGVTAGNDLSLALVEEDLGHAAALAVARHLVVFLKPPGGQAQFSAALSLQSSDERFANLHDNLFLGQIWSTASRPFSSFSKAHSFPEANARPEAVALRSAIGRRLCRFDPVQHGRDDGFSCGVEIAG